jgi:hypothetical protein
MIPACPTLLRHAPSFAGLPGRAPAVALAALAALSTAGCYFSDDGLSPPSRSFYFPTGLAVSPGRSALYVANSDFDLQYNGGTVDVVDLDSARGTLGKMLIGLRCAQQAKDACDALGVDIGQAPTVAQVCSGIAFRDGGGADNGKTCVAAGDCASGVCGEDSKCRACSADADCAAGNGKCGTGAQAGVCILAKNDNTILTPSACTPLAPPLAAGGTLFATIGAFASGAVMATNPEGPGARLFIPVRGDPSITWFDVDDDRTAMSASPSKLECGQRGSDKRCGDEHRMGIDPYDNPRTATLPVEPTGLDIADDGESIVSAHQISGGPAIGLSVNKWAADASGPAWPTFQFYLTSNVPAGPTEVARVPIPGVVAASKHLGGLVPSMEYEPGFLVSFNNSAEIDLYRYNDDALGRPPRPFITRAVAATINTNADGKDSRGLAVDASRRQDCEAACGATADTCDAGCSDTACQEACATKNITCQRACADIPLDIFMANRLPPSLLLGRVRTTITDSDVGSGAFDVPEIYDAVSLTTGPSKVALGKVIGLDGKLHTRVFAVTFDTRNVFSYDPETRMVDLIIKTGRGPHAIAFDTGDDGSGNLHSYLYVGHFTDSYLGVVDLDMRHPETFGIMFASIGTPTEPRESK